MVVYRYLVGLLRRYPHYSKHLAVGGDAIGVQVRCRDDKEDTLLLDMREEIVRLQDVAEQRQPRLRSHPA